MIKYLKTNNEGEYTSNEFNAFSKQEGINKHFSGAYTSQQNRVADG